METIHPLAPPRKCSIKATRKPLFSATDEPITATSTIPSGAKPEKLVITFVHRYWIPATEKRLKVSTVEPSAGLTAVTPSILQIAEIITTTTASPRNRVIGSGSLLPTRSIESRIRSSIPTFSFFVFSFVILLLSPTALTARPKAVPAVNCTSLCRKITY